MLVNAILETYSAGQEGRKGAEQADLMERIHCQQVRLRPHAGPNNLGFLITTNCRRRENSNVSSTGSLN